MQCGVVAMERMNGWRDGRSDDWEERKQVEVVGD